MEGFNVTFPPSVPTVADDHTATTITNQTSPIPIARAEWLVILDHTSVILMTCNTITLMLAMGAATYWREVWHHIRRPWGALVGTVCQFAFLPALGFGFCVAFHLPPYQALGVLILACSPGGAFSTFFTYWVNGDLALSILMTAMSSLLGFGLMPLNLWAYSLQWTNQEIKVPYINVLISLSFVTVPVMVGMVIRSFNRKWANYISKVCGILGWVGAVTCGIMLVLMYWDVIIKISINLMITAALVPIASVVVAYIVAKLVCFNHIICRTIAIETGCQNMVVATNVMLLSFGEPEIRGQMVIFPVLYGLCQLSEALVIVGLFQLWSYCHRDNIIEEEVKSVVDNSILTSVPVPSHRLSESRIQWMTGFVGTPDVCRLQKQRDSDQQTELSTYYRYFESSRINGRETQSHESDLFLTDEPTPYRDDVDQPTTWHQSADEETTIQPKSIARSFSIYGRPKSPTIFHFPKAIYTQSPTLRQTDTHRTDILDEYSRYSTITQKSPTLSNKGVPNMFPVTEEDFQPSRGSSPVPYGSPRPIPRDETHLDHWKGLSIPVSPSPTSPTLENLTSLSDSSKTFDFYHNDVCIGQAEHLSTFGRQKK